MENCQNCHKSFEGNYCPDCGQPARLRRIDGKYIRDEISSVFNLDKGILLTIKELFIRPGKSIKDFLTTDRHRLVKPILFILITSIAYSIINHYFKIEDQYVNYKGMKGTTGRMFAWVQDNYGYANIIMGIFIAGMLKLFFINSGYNFYEVLILLCFIMGMGMLIFALFALIQGITRVGLMTTAGIISMIYITLAIADFYGRKKPINYLKAVLAYVGGMVFFSISLLFSGILIDLIF